MVSLVARGKNIVSTHALFGNITDQLIENIRNQDYILVLDEVMNVVQKFDLYPEVKEKTEGYKDNLTKFDIAMLINKKIIDVDQETFKVTWISKEQGLGKYEILKNMADREMLFYVGKELLIWTFPIEVFREGVFREIFILTYQFDYQIQAYYYKYFELEYAKYTIIEPTKHKYELAPYDDTVDQDHEWKQKVKKLIHVCDSEKLNRIGDYYHDGMNRTVMSSLSKTWYETADPHIYKVLVQNIVNYFQHVAKSKATQRMWTCFKSEKNKIKNNNLSAKAWVELNSRATNMHIQKNVLVYPINRYLTPFFSLFFSKRNISIDQDKFALSELIQWIFRSAIREGKEIWIYIPSRRMRTLFLDWLNE